MKIAFLGDSLTEGWPGAAYLPLLARLCPDHELVNHGRAGDTVAGLLLRMRSTGLQPADLAFVRVGANDAVMGAWDPADEGGGWGWSARLARLRGDYEELLEWTAARAARLMCVRPLVLEAEGSLWEAHAGDIGDAVAAAAAGVSGAHVLDLGPAFAAALGRGEGPFTTDGVHLTDAGAQVVAAAFARTIDDIDRGGSAALQKGD
jgi:lysophospholipase L1-like esterase